MQQFNVTGMSCAACSSRVEKAVSKLPGVSSCSVSLLMNSMSVEGTASTQSIIAAVTAAGYGASEKRHVASDAENGNTSSKNESGSGRSALTDMGDALEDKETPLLKKRLIVSIGFLAVLMYISMGHMMWDWPLPTRLAENHIAIGILQLLLTAIIMVINQKFFISGFRGLWHRAPNMDTLVALGSSAAFCWSTVALFLMTDAQMKGDMQIVMKYMHEFYFESAAMILTLITIGKMLEARSKGKTTDAIKRLMKLTAETANIIKDGVEMTVPIEQVKKGNIFVVRPGESIPTDGVIIEGSTAVDESALTGESIPVDKTSGDTVSAATINTSGFIRCEATRVGEDTTLAQIIQTVSDAAASKAPIAKLADKVSGVFVPAVMGISLITLIVWLLIGADFAYALARAISVLVISCPCALGLATPVAIMVGNGVAARNGILFKTAVSLEESGKVKIAALDKTGTVTRGEPQLTELIPANGIGEDELLAKAAALEAGSEHPLAKAIIEAAAAQAVKTSEVSDFKALAGNGVSAVLNGKTLFGGSVKFIGEKTALPKDMLEEADRLAEQGKTPLVFTEDERVLGIIAVADTIKKDSAEAVTQLRELGIRVVMLTGDNEKTANAIGKQAGVDEVIAGVLPSEKAEVINRLKSDGKVLMVGDGINDAPALTSADIGMAIGAGSDIAIDAADVVLMKNSLSDAVAALRISRAALRNIRENLFWAFFYNTLGIPLAAGVFVGLGLTLNPMIGAAAMSLSSFCVVTNALRLNFCKPYKQVPRAKESGTDEGSEYAECSKGIESKSDNKEKVESVNNKNGGNKMIKTTLEVTGMMCPMCEKHMNEAIEKGFDVKSVAASHEKNEVEIVSETALDEAKLKAVVEETGYTPGQLTSCELEA